MNGLRIVFPLAVAALLAGLFIALDPTTIHVSSDRDAYLQCGNLFQFSTYAMGGWHQHISADGWLLVNENCGMARASKMPWAVTLTATGVALLVSSALIRRANRRPERRPPPQPTDSD